MPYKAIPCPICKVPRRIGGANKKHSVCKQCWLKGYGSRRWKTQVKPFPHQQFQSEQVADREARVPPGSWWICPREEWPQRQEEQRARFQAAGVGKPGWVIASER